MEQVLLEGISEQLKEEKVTRTQSPMVGHTWATWLSSIIKWLGLQTRGEYLRALKIKEEIKLNIKVLT